MLLVVIIFKSLIYLGISGAVLYFEIFGTIEINYCNFTDCKSLSDGNIVVSQENSIKINNSLFKSCSAANGGFLYLIYKNSLELFNSHFYDGNASYGGHMLIWT